MKKDTKATTAGSKRVVLPGSEGMTGTSRDAPHDEQTHPGVGNGVQARACKAVDTPVKHPVRSVFRKTELHGTFRNRTTEEKAKLRKRLMEEAGGPDIEELYQPVAEQFRSIIDTIIERQDRATEELLGNLADLQQRIDALESTRDLHRSATSDKTEACS